MNTMNKEILFFISLILVTRVVFAANVQVSIDSSNYLPNENITVSGKLYIGSSNATAGENLTIQISGANSTTKGVSTLGDGSFSTQINVSSFNNVVGTYYLSANYSTDFSNNLTFVVSSVYDIPIIPSEKNLTVNLSDNINNYNTTTGSTTNFTCGNVTLDQTYYFLVERLAGTYSRVYIDNDKNFNLTDDTEDSDGIREQKYLEKWSKAKLNEDYTIFYIDPLGTQLTLIKTVVPVFDYGSSVTLNVTGIVQNTTLSPVSGENVTLRLYNETGALQNSSLVTSNSYGVIYKQYDISSYLPGKYTLSANDISALTFEIKSFDFTANLWSETNETIFTIAQGGTVKIMARASASNGTAISGATVTATITDPSGSATTKSLTYDSANGFYISTAYTATAIGTYKVKIIAAYGVSQAISTTFSVKGFDSFIMPVAIEKGPAEGLAPGQTAYIFVSARNLSTGAFLNLADSTNNCNSANVTLTGVYNSKGVNKLTGTYSNYNLTTFYQSSGIPSFIQKEIQNYFGSGACVIEFTTPSETGVYSIKITVNVTGTIDQPSATIGIQNVFIRAHPVDEQGGWSSGISPGGTVRLAIDAFSAETGAAVATSNILDASLVSVFAESTGAVVTNYMINETFTQTTEGQFKVISFIVNDSVMGPHFVDFRVRINLSGTIIEAMGNGFFDEKLYRIFASSSQPFGSGDEAQLTVSVYDAAGTSGQNDVTITVDKVRMRDSWEVISLSSKASCVTKQSGSGSSAVNGQCTLRISAPSSNWSTGFYIVELNATDANNNQDYGFGFFSVQNFRLDTSPVTSTNKAGADIRFNVAAYTISGSGMGGLLTAPKLIFFGTKESFQPPTVVAENLQIKNEAGSFATQMSLPANSTTVVLNGSQITESGMYAIEFAVVNPSHGQQSSRAWFEVTVFVLSANTSRIEFGINETINITVTGIEEVTGTILCTGDCFGPPQLNGTPHYNLSSGWIMAVIDVGKFESPYLMGNQINSTSKYKVGTNCNSRNYTCHVWFNTTDFPQGEYVAMVAANDTRGSETVYPVFFRVKTLSVRSPWIWDINIEEYKKYTNSTTFTIKGDCNQQCQQKPNVTDCYAENDKMIVDGDDNGRTRENVIMNFAVGKNATNHYLLFINWDNQRNYTNTQWNSTLGHNNTERYTIGNTFIDRLGRNWTISNIVDNAITLQSPNAAVVSLSDVSSRYVLANITESKSGTILVNDYNDQEWCAVDLNDNYQQKNYSNGRYYIALVDKNVAGVYDTVWFSNTTDLRNAYVLPDYTGAIKYHPNAMPTYFLDVGYSSSGSSYKVKFTSGKISDWAGDIVATVKPGNIARIPLFVKTPTGTALANTTVNISSLTLIGTGRETRYTLSTPASGRTDDFGIVVIQLNTSSSGIPANTTGTFALGIDVNSSTYGWVSIGGEVSERPKMEIRNFMLRGEIGLMGTITMNKVSTSLGNLKAINTSQATYGRFSTLSYDTISNNYMCADGIQYSRGNEASDLRMMDDWNYHNVLVNVTSGVVYVVNMSDYGEPYCNLSNALNWSTENGTIRIPREHGSELMRISNLYDQSEANSHPTLTINVGASDLFMYINITVNSVNTTTNKTNLAVGRIDEGSWCSPVTREYNRYSYLTGCGGATHTINITSITGSSVTFTWDMGPAIKLESAWASEINMDRNTDGWYMRVANISGDMQLVFFDNASISGFNQQNCGNNYCHEPDAVALVNGSNVLGIYRYGELMRQSYVPAGWVNFSMVESYLWDKRAMFTNQTPLIYPLTYRIPRVGVGTDYYVGRFTEVDTGKDFNRDDILNATAYLYVFIWDNIPNGVNDYINVVWDDDYDIYMSDQETNADTYGSETRTVYPQGDYAGEHWEIVGQEGWITFLEFNKSYTNTTGRITTFSWQDFFSPAQINRSSPTIYVKALQFNSSAVSGTMKIESIEHFWSNTRVTSGSITAAVNLTNGVGKKELTHDALKVALNSANPSCQLMEPCYNAFGDFVVNVLVNDTVNNKIEKFNRWFMVMGEGKGPGMGPSGPGGGPGGGP